MKKKFNKTILSLAVILSVVSCMKPRVELDDTRFGDTANIVTAQIFRYVEVTNNLGYGEPVTGYQTQVLSTPTNTVDKPAATVTIVAAKGTDLTKIGIRFTHYAKKVEPLNGTPAAGTIADYSKGRFVYRLTSADGTVRDWTVNISVAP